jgi:imidazolonepropionase-like amidohydrolase
MKRPSTVLTILIVIWLAGCGEQDWQAAEAEPQPTTILGAKLIDGTSAEPIDDSVVVIEGTRIQAAGSRAETPVPKGGRIIDGTGKTVIPGLIELHAHYFGDRAEMERLLRAQLRFGVTTSRSIGADKEEHLGVIADTRARKIPAPRLYTAGLGFTHPDGHPIQLPFVRRPATEEEARAGVAELAAQRVDFIKMWVESKNGTLPKITPAMRQTIVEEASKRHIPTVAHVFDLADLEQLIDIGVKQFLHTVRDTDEISSELLDRLKAEGVSFVPTFTVAERAWYFAENPGVLDDPELRSSLDSALLADSLKEETRSKLLANPMLPQLKDEYVRGERFVMKLAGHGIRIGVGSDSGAGVIPTGWGTHHEMQLLVRAGLTPMQALRAATGEAAAMLSEGEPAFGTIAPGKAADLLILAADPLADIANTRKIDRVMQAGRWLDR